MGRPITFTTPPDRPEKWKKKWTKPVALTGDETESAFQQFQEAFIPSHMGKRFLKIFGVPKAAFGNRFFYDDAVYRTWETKLSSQLPGDATHVDVTVLYGSPDSLEGWRFRGETRRSLKDLFLDDMYAACAIVEVEGLKLYLFVEPKMKGAVLRSIRAEQAV